MDVCIARNSESGGGVAQAVCLRSHVIWVELFGAWFWKGYGRAGQIVISQGLQTCFVERLVLIFFLQLSSVPNVYLFIYITISLLVHKV